MKTLKLTFLLSFLLLGFSAFTFVSITSANTAASSSNWSGDCDKGSDNRKKKKGRKGRSGRDDRKDCDKNNSNSNRQNSNSNSNSNRNVNSNGNSHNQNND